MWNPQIIGVGKTAICIAAASLAAGAGCALRKAGPPATVLSTQDFVADPTTVPTDLRPPALMAERPAPAATPPISVAAASEGILNVTGEAGAPTGKGTAAPGEPPVLVDAKGGEINGRPVRAEEGFDAPGGGGELVRAKAADR